MSRPIGSHVRGNLISYVAIFVALGGTAWAGATVNSSDVIDESLKSEDLKDAAAVKAADVVDGSLTGADIDESTLADVPNANQIYGGFSASDFAKPGTSVGGDVKGTFSDMQLKSDVVTSSVIRNGTVTRADLSNSGGGAFGAVSSTGGLSRFHNVSSVTNPSTGVYCIKAIGGIDPADRGLVAVPDYADDTTTSDSVNGGEGSTTVEWNSKASNCVAGKFEVDTFKQDIDGNQVYENTFYDEGFSFVIR